MKISHSVTSIMIDVTECLMSLVIKYENDSFNKYTSLSRWMLAVFVYDIVDHSFTSIRKVSYGISEHGVVILQNWKPS